MPPAPSSASPGARLGRAAARWIRSPRTRNPSGAAGQALRRAGRTLLASFLSTFARLGLQISAVLYLCFALAFGAAGIRSWLASRPADWARRAPAPAGFEGNAGWELALALLFLYFGISSLLRASRRASGRGGRAH